MSEKSQQIKQENQNQINSFLPMIKHYQAKYTDYKNQIEWNNTILMMWEFNLLIDNKIIDRRGIIKLADYSYFTRAKIILSNQRRKQQFAKNINTPPEPAE